MYRYFTTFTFKHYMRDRSILYLRGQSPSWNLLNANSFYQKVLQGDKTQHLILYFLSNSTYHQSLAQHSDLNSWFLEFCTCQVISRSFGWKIQLKVSKRIVWFVSQTKCWDISTPYKNTSPPSFERHEPLIIWHSSNCHAFKFSTKFFQCKKWFLIRSKLS